MCKVVNRNSITDLRAEWYTTATITDLCRGRVELSKGRFRLVVVVYHVTTSSTEIIAFFLGMHWIFNTDIEVPIV